MRLRRAVGAPLTWKSRATRQKLERFWSEQISDDPAPAVDFRSESVLFLLMGSRSSGGYGVETHAAHLDDKTLVVDATVKQPMSGTVNSQAITAPYAVVAVSARQFTSAEWKSEGELVWRVDVAP